MHYLNTSIPLIIMGITSMLLQITVLRLLLSTFSGNELDIGITLSFWLVYVGLGSYIGRKIKFRHAFALSFVIIAILSLPTAFSIKAIRTILSLEPGEAVSFSSTIFSTAITLFPMCLIIGLQFPLAGSFSGGRNAAARVYGLEALGAFIGGTIYTFLISSRVNSFELCLLLSLVNVSIAIAISRKKLISTFFIIPFIFYFGFHGFASTLPWHGLEISQHVESKYGEITVIKVRDQSSIYTNGHLMLTYPDSQTEEMNTHLSISLHPSPSDILIIGGSPGILRESLKYPLNSIEFIELDPKIVEIALNLLTKDDRESLQDRRIKIIIEDGRRFIKGLNKPAYDLIILNLPQPSTAGINRFYTTDFFKEVKNALKKDGIIVISIPQSTGYIGKRMQTACGSIYNSLKSVFRYVEVTAQEYGGLFASDSVIDTDPIILETRFVKRNISAQHFNQYIFRDAFSPFNVDYVKKRLGEVKLVNTDLLPSAYLYNLMLWADIHGGKILHSLLRINGWNLLLFTIIILASISFISWGKKKPVIYFSIFTTGFSGMSFVLAIILAYQSLYGYIYEMIGALSATFMIGLWTGTFLTRTAKESLKILFTLELITIILAIIAPLFFVSESLFYLLVFLFGTITGCQFSSANLSMGDPDAGGKLYAVDLIGSFSGALIPSLVIIPLFGISNTLLLIAVIKAFSALIIMRLLTRQL
jgi:spermidine synthase